MYKSHKKLILVLLLNLLITTNLMAGKIKSNDLNMWSGVEVQYDIHELFELQVSEQIRFDQDISKFESNLIDIGVQYKPLDFMKFAAFYRLKSRTDEKNHVLILSAYAEKEIKRLSMEYRLRFDNEPNQDKDNEYYLRNRLELYYNIKGPVDPFISGELFYRFNYDKGDRFNSYRLRIGTDFKIAKNQKLTLHYTYDSEFNMKKIDIKRVIGLFYTIEL